MKKLLKNILLRLMKLIPIFMSITEKKMQLNENRCKYIVFTIDVYFTEYLLAIEIDEKDHTDIDFIFEEKRKKALEKNLVINLLELIRLKKAMMQTMNLVEYKHLSVNLKTNN